ncbi:MAG: phasin family protein [Gammaproteobacteria bacterium]|nr:phasin family protein [Gammaproteobacteria bacterium]MBV8307354.1 phasin family protein [Gammaproteobacteria bacterium]MBV8404033.1 phasin family protein [Gammaproteobacteria bacterium]
MRDRNQIDWNVWLDTYKDTYASFSKAQHEGLRALERFARFNYAVAGDVLEAGLAQAKATLGARAALGTEALAELLGKQAELGSQLTDKIRERAEEFSTLAAEVQDSVGSFATAASRTRGNGRSQGARKSA